MLRINHGWINRVLLYNISISCSNAHDDLDNDGNIDDQLNNDFIKLAKEASALHHTLADDRDNIDVRNRLTNVKVKLSDVQQR